MEKNEIIKQEKNEVTIQDNKEIASDIMLEEIISKAIQIPGVKVDRNKFLAEVFSSKVDLLENIINNGPVEAGITREEAVKLGLPEKSYLPQTLEEKIVAHADNLVSGSEEVDIDFVIKKWKRRIADSDGNIKRLIELDNELIKAFEE